MRGASLTARAPLLIFMSMRQASSDWLLSSVSRTTETKRMLLVSTELTCSSRQFSRFFIFLMEKENEFSQLNVSRIKKENVSAEMVFPDHKKELSNNRKLIKEEGATCGPEESSGIKSISEPEQSVLETNEEELLRLNPETPKRESPAQEEEESSAAASVQDEDLQQLLEELIAEREEAHQLNKQLQMRLVEYFHNEPIDGGRLQRGRPEEEQLQEYEKNIQILCELKLQLSTASQAAQQEAEELRLQSQEKVDKVGVNGGPEVSMATPTIFFPLSSNTLKGNVQAY